MPQAPSLTCRLFFKDRVPETDEFPVAVVELENTGAVVLEVALVNGTHPFLNLDLVIESQDGRRLVKQRYGLAFINRPGKTKLWRLNPGERFAQTICLDSGVAREKLSSERYRVQAVYDAGSVRALSDVLTVSRDQLRTRR